MAPDDTFVVEPSRLQHKHAVSPFAGRELHGVVRQTWLRGRLIYRNGELEAPRGMLLRRNGHPAAG